MYSFVYTARNYILRISFEFKRQAPG